MSTISKMSKMSKMIQMSQISQMSNTSKTRITSRQSSASKTSNTSKTSETIKTRNKSQQKPDYKKNKFEGHEYDKCVMDFVDYRILLDGTADLKIDKKLIILLAKTESKTRPIF